jgi:hypothetical protein
MKEARALYESANGHRWQSIRDPSGTLFIHHEANAASGGHVEHKNVVAFLSRGNSPEQRELLRLIGASDRNPCRGTPSPRVPSLERQISLDG